MLSTTHGEGVLLQHHGMIGVCAGVAPARQWQWQSDVSCAWTWAGSGIGHGLTQALHSTAEGTHLNMRSQG
jgi:hypothetical protein